MHCFFMKCFVRDLDKRIIFETRIFLLIISTSYINMNSSKLQLCLRHLNTNIFNSANKISIKPLTCKSKEFSTSVLLQIEKSEAKKEESVRMKQFHTKLKLQPIPRIPPKERFVDLVLVDTDTNGELIPDSEKDPTKWGDWQNGGRVSDF